MCGGAAAEAPYNGKHS